MFFPIGGVFVFGHGSPRLSFTLAIFNLVMGVIALAIGYSASWIPLIVIGYIIGGLGLLQLLSSLFNRDKDKSSDDSSGI